MNGFSLLVVLATVGTSARVETDATGQPSYTIRIESVLVDQLRQGQMIESNVAAADRRTKRFRVLVTDPASRSSGLQARTDSATRSESLFEYEAVRVESNEIEMWVQISPERLETLANRPIEGQVPAEVPEIDRYRIFVGINQLPRQQQAAATTPDSRPPYQLNDNSGLTTAGAEVRPASDNSRRTTTTPGRTTPYPSNNSAFQTGTSGYQGGFGSTITAPPLANTGARPNDPRTAWRNSADQSTVAPPPLDRYGQSQVVSPSINNSGAFNTSTTSRFDDQYAHPAYNDRAAQQYNDRANGYTYGGNTTTAPPNIGQPQYAQAPPAYPPNQYANNQGYGQPQTMLASRPDTQLVQQAAPAPNNWNQPVTGGLTATQQPVTQNAAATVPVNAAATVTSSGKEKDEAPTTSTPLILTTLALFTSLGVNAYLGWLAWSFFWRYRDAVNDSARARSYNAPGRQAA